MKGENKCEPKKVVIYYEIEGEEGSTKKMTCNIDLSCRFSHKSTHVLKKRTGLGLVI